MLQRIKALATRGSLILLAVAGAGVLVYQNPPMQGVGRGEIGVRSNLLNGQVTEWREGSVVVFPGLHHARVYSLRDQTYRPEQISRADGPAPLQSLEGLSLGVDLSVRYALDPEKLRSVSAKLPDDIGSDIVEPAVQGVMAREGALVTSHPLLIQKAMADKLSDKIQVIIAPAPMDSSFIGSALLGGKK